MGLKVSEIYLLDSKIPVKGQEQWSNSKFSIAYRLEELAERSGFSRFIEEGDLVALKVHFGDHGTTRALRSLYIRKMVEIVRSLGGEPFVTETCGLGMIHDRNRATGRIKIARENGYTYETLEAPIIISDGIKGFDYVEVDAPKPLEKVAVAKAIYEADKVVALTHVTAHMGSGFGGAIKNIGVGCVAKPTKFDLHHGEKPKIIEDRCTLCRKCEKICTSGAIRAPEIDSEKCIKCDGCSEVCGEHAIKVDWTDSRELSQRITRAAGAVLNSKGKDKFFYFNFMLEVTPHCDCFSFSDSPMAEDAGILAGSDILAIDRASADIINRGNDIFLSLYPEVDYRVQFETAEALCLGSSEYKIVKLENKV